MNTQTATNTAITPYVINATELEKFGLRQEDESEIQAVAERIDASNPDTVYQFGTVMLRKILQLMQIAFWNRSEIKIWMTLALS
ncbi:hypothetical protein AB2G23_26065 (plasmid) [Escherichia coli]